MTTKKSFESTAKEISEGFVNPILRKQVAGIVARIFAEDNPGFNPAMFYRTCGLEPPTGVK